MKKGLLVVTLLAVGFGYSALCAMGGGGKIKFGDDYDKALSEAKKQGKPVMIYFTQDG